MVTATPEGKIPKRKSQITNKSKITNSNSKTESKIWRCDRSNSSENKRHSIHGVFVLNLGFSDLEFVWDLSFVFWDFAPKALFQSRNVGMT